MSNRNPANPSGRSVSSGVRRPAEPSVPVTAVRTWPPSASPSWPVRASPGRRDVQASRGECVWVQQVSQGCLHSVAILETPTTADPGGTSSEAG